MSHFDVEFAKNNFLKISYWPIYEQLVSYKKSIASLLSISNLE